MRQGKTVFLNGEYILRDNAGVSMLEPGYISGFGLFETMRSYHGKIIYLMAHLERINKSCRMLQIKFPYSPQKMERIIRHTVRINGFKDAYVRLTVWKKEKGSDLLVVTNEYKPYSARIYARGFRASIGWIRHDAPEALRGLKTINRIIYELNFRQAKEKGFDEALLLDSRGFISEGARSNLFFVKDNVLFTPALECGCLEGITRMVIFDLARKINLNVYEGKFTAADLSCSDEAFLTNSLMGIMPLAGLEKTAIGNNRCRRLTRIFTQKYNYLLR